ncbi:MAG: helix-hairpin-helix domain-containing protein [Bacilli bacterium]|nr:helix-hairpin-helix domain-containing protein [Bacilli bacterium]
MVIIVYSREEVIDFHKTKEIEEQVQERCNQKDAESLINNACISTSSEVTNSKISINTATKEELMTLTGIGESKAKDIIDYREKNGPFKTIEELMKVNGIGENIFAQIKENITI